MDHILYNILEAVFFVLWELIWLKFDLSWEQNGIKGDPERLRKEREELVLQKKKEKARLQAEAEAAEDARRQAEAEAAAEAAAEAKRKRELEREAARQALLKVNSKHMTYITGSQTLKTVIKDKHVKIWSTFSDDFKCSTHESYVLFVSWLQMMEILIFFV
jgi:uncharacterized membrane protein